MSIAHAIGDQIRTHIAQYLTPALAPQNITFHKEDIVHDFARVTGTGLEATFYVTTIENVNRKLLMTAVAALQQLHPELQTLRVKSKRPGQCVRFHLVVGQLETQEQHSDS